MTLEDFFTLTEMKNGLTTCARVEELICVMQKLNCVTNNVGDAARQWSTAASTLACTQNQECLSLFVHLNGLGFLNHWLQEAVKCSRDVSDGEELINTLIGSLDKLPMNPDKLSSSGILMTIENLFGHTNVNIKEKARMLFDKWNNRRANDTGCEEMEKDSSYPVDSLKPSIDTPSIEEVDNSSCQTADEGSCKVESGKILNHLVTSDNDLRLGDVDHVKCSIQSQTLPVLSSIENEHHNLIPTIVASDAGLENFAVQEGNFISKAEIESPEIQVKADDLCDTSVRNVVKAELNNGKGDSWEFRETSCVLSSSGLSVTSHTKNPKVIRSASCSLTLDEGKQNLSDTKETLHRCASVDKVWPEYSKTMEEFKSGEHDYTDILGSNKGSSWRKESAENSGDIDHCNEPTLNACEGADTSVSDDPSRTFDDQLPREMDKSSDSEPESGEMDALEIARLVAIEVEREVVDYREELCSSSPEVSSNEVMNTSSPSIVEGKQGHPILGEANENKSVPINDDGDVTSSPKDDNRMFAEMSIDPSKQNQSLESSNGAAVIQESRAMAEIGKFDFDLNEEACTEDDIDCAVNPIHPNNLVNLSAPIAVSASKGAPVFLIFPLCFEGGLGWKGSAATSAFRPASPRRAFDGEKSESGSKYKASLLELDLNLTDCENYLPVDTASMKEVPVSSSMPSWNSSSEVSSLRAERIKLDLNSNGEDEAAPYRSPLATHHLLNGGQSSSPASSSSSLRQLPPKNFDLNDSLFSSDTFVSKNTNPSKAANPHGIKTDDPVSTIMGSRMPAERRAHTNQTHQAYIGNGLSLDSTLPNGPFLPYPHQIPHPSYGYMAPTTGMAVPFQPAVYGFGNISHMVDSRGATVVPQLLSSAGANGTPLATLPYLMSITNAPSSSNGGGSSQPGPGLDLNFGMMQMETGTPEMGNLKHPLMPGHTGLMEEQINSGNSLKRKEPESGWEPYNFGYKHLASWH